MICPQRITSVYIHPTLNQLPQCLHTVYRACSGNSRSWHSGWRLRRVRARSGRRNNPGKVTCTKPQHSSSTANHYMNDNDVVAKQIVLFTILQSSFRVPNRGASTSHYLLLHLPIAVGTSFLFLQQHMCAKWCIVCIYTR